MLVLALAVGCSNKPDDVALVTNIKSQMFSDPQLKGASLQVTSHDGQVTLTGTVPNDGAHLDAYKIASQTPGVTKVIDQVAVEAAEAPPMPAAQPKAAAPPARRAREKKPSSVPSDAEVTQEVAPPAAPAPQQQEAAVTQPAPASPASAPPPAPQPTQVPIPAGTTMTIRMIDGVDSSVNRPGEIFHASLEAPLVEGDQVVVSKGADVYVRLASANSSGKMTGQSELRLELVKLEFQGQSYSLVSSTYSLAGASRGKDTAKKVGAGAVLGTLLGAVIGGGKGAAIGAGVGAGAGGVYQASTRGKQVKIASETKLDFQLEQPVTITVQPKSHPSEQ